MKLIVEVGSLEYKQRLKLLCKLEENGITIKEKSKKLDPCIQEFMLDMKI